MDLMKDKVRRCAALLLTAMGMGCGAGPAPCPEVPGAAGAPARVTPATASAPGVPRETAIAVGYAFAFGAQELVIDPTEGGRVTSFTFGGKNVLRERGQSTSYGSSFWTSPQSDWGWPPPFELDHAPWDARVDGAALVLSSKPVPSLSLQATQRVSVDVAKEAVTFEYSIQNVGSAPRKVAPWQNTRVAPGGLTFYPSGGPLAPESTLEFDASGEVAFFSHDPARFKEGVKSFGDGREGWLAHVDGDLVLIKAFPDVPRELQAPKEAEIELYVDGAGKFVEVEQQGPYTELAPGASSTWSVRWYLRRLPAGVRAEPGSEALVDFVRNTLR